MSVIEEQNKQLKSKLRVVGQKEYRYLNTYMVGHKSLTDMEGWVG